MYGFADRSISVYASRNSASMRCSFIYIYIYIYIYITFCYSSDMWKYMHWIGLRKANPGRTQNCSDCDISLGGAVTGS